MEIARGRTTALWRGIEAGMGETEIVGERTYCWKAPEEELLVERPWAWLWGWC